MNKIRVRFGVRAFSFLPNAGVFVIYLSPDAWNSMQGVVSTLKGLLSVAGYSSVSDKIVCEAA